MELVDLSAIKLKLNNEKFLNPYIVKCIVLGHYGVGKSTMNHMFATGFFDPNISSTVAMDFYTKKLYLSDNQIVKVQVWDSAGQEKYRSIISSYIRDTYITFIVFDITDRKSWDDVDIWKDLTDQKNNQEISRIVLVGTKEDKKNHMISIEEIKNKADLWNCNYYITSSKHKNSANLIHQMFYNEVESLHQQFINSTNPPINILKEIKSLDLDDQEKNDSCCF